MKWLLLVAALALVVAGCSATAPAKQETAKPAPAKPRVAVAIVPQETFVKAVAGDLVDVVTMIALEKDGKDITPSELGKIVDEAKQKGIKVIFYQAEIDSQQTKAFAESIGGKAEQVSPLSGDYINNLAKTATTFATIMK